jgi:hypothetical protein
LVCLAFLVCLVCLVWFVWFVCLVWFVRFSIVFARQFQAC